MGIREQGKSLDNALIWCVRVEGRYSVTGRNLSTKEKDSLAKIHGAVVIERGPKNCKFIIPCSSLTALREQCQASQIRVTVIEPNSEAEKTSRQRGRDDGRKRGRFIRFGCRWTFRFDR